jgi:hypothetical protein
VFLEGEPKRRMPADQGCIRAIQEVDGRSDVNEDDGGSYPPTVVSRSACRLALLARRSAFKLGMLAQAVP